MVDKKVVPKGATESVATLVYPPEFTDECPSNWYIYNTDINFINFCFLNVGGVNNENK
jgi:hypothetical protein